MNLQYNNIAVLFNELLIDIVCQADTKAYILGIYGNYRLPEFDLSKGSVSLLLAQGHEKQDFFTYQKLGDWIFFASTIVPKYLTNASQDYYHSVAQLSYYSCYKLINKQWKLFEELADNLPSLEHQIKQKLSCLKMTQY